MDVPVKDADGMTLKVGDTVTFNDTEYTIQSIDIDDRPVAHLHLADNVVTFPYNVYLVP